MHNLLIFLILLLSISWIPDDLYAQLNELRQDVYIKEEYHCLSVPKVATFTVYDNLDCAFKCLRNPSCLSINLAASKGADGKLWCELLSSEKHSNPKEYKRNKSFHHFFQMSPCMSSPCQNGGTCVANYKNYNSMECHCKEGFVGEFCETVAKSCQVVYDHLSEKLNGTHLVTLVLDSEPISILCHFNLRDFGCGDGGWTPVMKMDGNKSTFRYDDNIWKSRRALNLNGGKTGFDSQETKLPSYWSTSFSKICLGMKIAQQPVRFIVINKQANSLYSLIADGQYRNTSLGRETWKSLIGPEASLQPNCNKEGFNVKPSGGSRYRTRIGILGNNEDNCGNCDSVIGFGNSGKLGNYCGNLAPFKADNGDKNITGIGYVLVQ